MILKGYIFSILYGLVCLALGVAIGELLRIDDRINAWGSKIEAKAGVDGFAKGFVTASLMFCIGAMAIFGALKDGADA